MDRLLAADAALPTGKQIEALGVELGFLLDCLYRPEPDVREAALAQLAQVVKHPIDLDPKADPARQAAAIESLRVRHAWRPTQP